MKPAVSPAGTLALPELAPDAAEQAYARLLQALRQRRRDWQLVGIHTGGVWLAQRLAQDLGLKPPGALDISFYRDDFSRIGLHPQVRPSAIPFELEGASLLLIDDVLFTGRTLRAAMNALFDYGRPARIDLAVLADRLSADGSTRELPIAPTFSGMTLTLPESARLNLNRHDTHFHLTLEQHRGGA
jgi:pyrimidine operon attenuation protein/uracil phosphoribosyltransferase